MSDGFKNFCSELAIQNCPNKTLFQLHQPSKTSQLFYWLETLQKFYLQVIVYLSLEMSKNF